MAAKRLLGVTAAVVVVVAALLLRTTPPELYLAEPFEKEGISQIEKLFNNAVGRK